MVFCEGIVIGLLCYQNITTSCILHTMLNTEGHIWTDLFITAFNNTYMTVPYHKKTYERCNLTFAMSMYKWAPVSCSDPTAFHLPACVSVESRYSFVFVTICWGNTFSFFRQKSINRAAVTEQTTEAFD